MQKRWIVNNFQKNTSEGFLDTSLAAMVTLFAVVIIASFYAGVLYEGRSTARQAQSDLQAQQQSTQRTIFWLADERSASDTRLGLQPACEGPHSSAAQ